MCLFCRSAGSVLAILCLVSCAKPAVDEGISAPSNTTVMEEKAAQGVVVTGGRISAANRAADALYESYPAPPPPPPPAAPGMYPQQWTPPYHDQGRDKFTTVAENAF